MYFFSEGEGKDAHPRGKRGKCGCCVKGDRKGWVSLWACLAHRRRDWPSTVQMIELALEFSRNPSFHFCSSPAMDYRISSNKPGLFRVRSYSCKLRISGGTWEVTTSYCLCAFFYWMGNSQNKTMNVLGEKYSYSPHPQPTTTRTMQWLVTSIHCKT